MAEPEAHRDPQAMQQFFARYGVTTTHFVPSMLAAFVASLDADSVAACRTLRRYSAAAKRCRRNCAASGSA